MPHDVMIKPEDVNFVKTQAAFHRRMVEKFSTDLNRKKRHLEISEQFDDLAKRIEALIPLLGKKPPIANLPGQLRIGSLDDLPIELRKQIKISDSDKLEIDILEVIQSFDGVAAIDEILVALWRKTNEILERDFLARKIYRMVQGHSVFSAKKKGYYQLIDPEGEAARQVEMDIANENLTLADILTTKRLE